MLWVGKVRIKMLASRFCNDLTSRRLCGVVETVMLIGTYV